MTWMEVVQIIQETAEKHGFSTEGDTSKGFPHIVQEKEAYATLSICVPMDYETCDRERGTAVYKPEIYTVVLHRGGVKTPEELFEAAEQIRRVAKLAEELKGMDLSYTMPLKGAVSAGNQQ